MANIPVKDSAGTTKYKLTHNDGSTSAAPAADIQMPFNLAVSMGMVDGYSSVNKFGHNPAATDGDDVWHGGGTYGFYPTSAVSIDIKSSSGSDVAAGTGARTVIVQGLDENWEEATSAEITLTGGTEVAIAGTWTRISRCIVLTAGSGGTNAGNITVQCVGAGGGLSDNTVGIYVAAGDGQTQQTIYTIPAGKSGYFIKGYVGVADDDKNGEVAEFQWQMRLNNGTTGAWAVKGEMATNSGGASHWQYEYGVPTGPIPAKTDIRIKMINTTAGAIGVVGGYDLILKDD